MNRQRKIFQIAELKILFVVLLRILQIKMSLAKNVTAIGSGLPRMVVTWDRANRIKRNKEIWDNPNSVVHRLPRHYQDRYWKVPLLK